MISDDCVEELSFYKLPEKSTFLEARQYCPAGLSLTMPLSLDDLEKIENAIGGRLKITLHQSQYNWEDFLTSC